jgi:hypothetical protein
VNLTFGILLIIGLIATGVMAARNAERADKIEDEVARLRDDIALANGRIHQRIRGLEERE